MFCKSIIKKPYIFRSLLYDHPQGLSFVLSAFTTFPLLNGVSQCADDYKTGRYLKKKSCINKYICS
jgi:hypothetical protein